MEKAKLNSSDKSGNRKNLITNIIVLKINIVIGIMQIFWIMNLGTNLVYQEVKIRPSCRPEKSNQVNNTCEQSHDQSIIT